MSITVRIIASDVEMDLHEGDEITLDAATARDLLNRGMVTPVSKLGLTHREKRVLEGAETPEGI